MKRKKRESGKISVTFAKSDHKYILEHTLVDETAFGLGTVSGDNIGFVMSNEQIEDVLGYIAAEANHAKSRKVEKELDRIYDLLESYLDE